MQRTSPQSSHFAPILKQKLHIPKSMQSGFTGQNNCCLIWDMPCPVPGSTTTLLPLTWEAGTSPTDLFGLGHSWVQTAQAWQREATYWAPFSQRCKTWTCLILKKRWNRLAHPFEFVRVGKLIVRQGRRCGNWRAACQVQNWSQPPGIGHKAKTHLAFVYERRFVWRLRVQSFACRVMS